MNTNQVTDDRFFLTGNRGHIFANNEAHIARKGHHPNTLCGIPILFTNYYTGLSDEEKQAMGVCSHCEDEYKQATGTKMLQVIDSDDEEVFFEGTEEEVKDWWWERLKEEDNVGGYKLI